MAIDGELHLLAMTPVQLIALAEDALTSARRALADQGVEMAPKPAQQD